jgi:hypothetical protein
LAKWRVSEKYRSRQLVASTIGIGVLYRHEKTQIIARARTPYTITTGDAAGRRRDYSKEMGGLGAYPACLADARYSQGAEVFGGGITVSNQTAFLIGIVALYSTHHWIGASVLMLFLIWSLRDETLAEFQERLRHQ